MAASFAVSLAVCACYLTAPWAILVAFTASFLESLPLADWDNLVVPWSAAFLCLAIM
jgi:hypothetical protein